MAARTHLSDTLTNRIKPSMPDFWTGFSIRGFSKYRTASLFSLAFPPACATLEARIADAIYRFVSRPFGGESSSLEHPKSACIAGFQKGASDYKKMQFNGLERWLSGRKRRFAKPLYALTVYRGFESLSLRHFPLRVPTGTTLQFSPKPPAPAIPIP